MMSVSVSVFVVLSLCNSSENLILLQRRWVFRRTGLFQEILKENIKNVIKILKIQKKLRMWIINLILLQRRWMFRTTGLLQKTRRQMLLHAYRDLQQGGLSPNNCIVYGRKCFILFE